MSDAVNLYEDLATPTTAMEEAAELSRQLIEAEEAMNKAEQAFKNAKAAYDHLAMETIPEFYKANGISKMTLADGTVLSVEQKITCSPKKESKPELIKWLKSKGGEDLVKEELAVNNVFADKLKDLGVPFIAKGDVNTNSLKSWLSEQLGLKAGCVSRMNFEDIPDYVNFYRYNTTTVSKAK
jgi:hypothetical protein